jgi:hydrogenase maturation protein HypF
VAHLLEVLEVEPELVVHDLHPDFYSSRFAARFAAEHGIPVLAVQHHHAHVAAVAAEHGIGEPVLGLALDGVGLGADGTPWGGELLRVHGANMQRLGSLAPLALPGGDAAAREPWRMAASALHALGRGDEITRRFPEAAAPVVAAMLERGTNQARSGSCGRLFDAAAGLLRVKDRNAFEGQAAMLLEGLAAGYGRVSPMLHGFELKEGRLSFLPLLDVLADARDAAAGAALFHSTLAAGLSAWVVQAAWQQRVRRVALGGGCFLNALLRSALEGYLREEGITVLLAEQAPPNDGGLALGQAWIGINHLRS